MTEAEPVFEKLCSYVLTWPNIA